ncbi:MAG: YmdB family metallophosphoesterase [Clostridia bacterium]|nr:YmdB family metallophosphoesterase [Clostridia bacterium]
MIILFIGDIFGVPGRDALFHGLYNIKKREGVDLCIANGENAASNGRGLSGRDACDIMESGVDVITMGNHVWSCREFEEFADRMPVVRPANIGRGRPGKGYLVTEVNGVKVGVCNIEGRAFIDIVGDDIFACADDCIGAMKAEGAAITVVDFHAEATSEKKLVGMYLDGKVTAVLGTHTHVQTADETVLPGGTGYITDAGMTGISKESIIGMAYKGVYEKYALGRKSSFEPVKHGTLEIRGVVIDADETTGKCRSVKRIAETVVPPV